MKIYIDESGIFSNPQNKPHTISCTAALVIPEYQENEILEKFNKISSSWVTDADEIKGSRLTEPQVAAIISLLKNYKVIFEVCAIDLGIHTNEEIEKHKLSQGHKLIENITPDFHPSLVNELNDLKIKIEKMPNQLYVQFMTLTETVNSILRSAMLYYCHSFPETLRSFNWIIDAKDKQKTEYENIWSILAMVFLQSVFLNDPVILLDSGDFSSLREYESKIVEIPNHLKKYAKEVSRSSQFDLKKILTENLYFSDSKESLGLEIVDILVNAVRRAFNRNLQSSGWGEIGSLMLKKFHGEHSINMIMLKPGTKIIILTNMLPYFDVLKEIDSKSKTALPTMNVT